MSRRLVPLALTLALGITPAVALAGGATAQQDGRAAVSRANLPQGWQPEGVTTGRRGKVYSGSLADGRIARVNTRTGRVVVLPDSKVDKPSVGLDYDRRRRVLWVAGGPEGEIRVVQLGTGRVLRTYTLPTDPDGRFINDLVVTAGAVYATDSFNQELAVVELPASLSLPPSGEASLMPLTGEVNYVAGEFNGNGIVESANGKWLVLVQSFTGQLFRVNPTTGRTKQLDLNGKRVKNGDGLELRSDILYVVRNVNNRVDVFDLSDNVRSGKRVEVIRNDRFDTPTTGTLVGKHLWVANARFGVAPEDAPTASYWLKRVKAFKG